MTIIIAFVVIFFTIVQLIVAFVNLLLKPDLTLLISENRPLVSVLIPARNEEKNIGLILNDLIGLEYKNLEIIVFDDQSEDQTAQIVKLLALTDNRINLISSPGLPDGWLGKNFACHTLSSHAHGEYFLFLDADVRIERDIISQTISYSDRYNLGLLSIFPHQMLESVGERITVPLMNYILLTLLPLPLVLRSGLTSLAAANGQFMLFNANVYRDNLPHQAHKGNRVEDIAIARYYKVRKIQVACLTGNKSIKCRMYNGFNEAVIGFSKNITAFFGNSFLLATLFWLITTLGFIPILLAFQLNIFIGYLVIVILSRIIVAKTSKQQVLESLIYLIPQQLTIGWVILRAFMNNFFYHYQWKGRNVS
jgi:glycosyltransferase involved in cell wall biosynthesis